MKILVSSVAVLTILASAAACSEAPDPATVSALTDCYWHCSLGNRDFIYAMEPDGRGIGGATHVIEDGRQLTTVDITGVSLDGTAIEISFSSVPPYRGRIDLEAGTITGGHPTSPIYREMNLTRVERADWPMVTSRPTCGEDSVWTQPVISDDGWKTGAPPEVGLAPSAVHDTVTAICNGDAGALHSFLVVRNGTLVVEEYFHGWSADDLHPIASCTKSVSSLLVGIAIDQGSIAGVDVPLLEFFPERRTLAGNGWQTLRLEHLLTMTMGLDWTDAEAERFPRPGEDRLADVLKRDVAQEPGTQWRYVSRNTNLLSQVLFHATGSHADVFAAEHLFGPLGIRTWDWDQNKFEGHPSMSGTLKLRPRDMAKIGQLVLDRGVWNGQRVVSSEWIQESTGTRVPSSGDENYGYLWRSLDEPRPGGVILALGVGTQIIAVAPDLATVVVVTGGNEFNGRLLDIMDVMKRHLLPGLS